MIENKQALRSYPSAIVSVQGYKRTVFSKELPFFSFYDKMILKLDEAEGLSALLDDDWQAGKQSGP